MTSIRLSLLFAFGVMAAFASADDVSSFVSGPGTFAYLGAGTLLPLLRDGTSGRIHSLRTADALLVSLVASQGLKELVHAPRPDRSSNDSFPSQHTTLAFAVATMESQYHPKEAPLWYGAAAWIGQSRVALRKHNVLDVFAGAGLGYGLARLELSLKHGYVLRPIIGGSGIGLSLSGTF